MGRNNGSKSGVQAWLLATLSTVLLAIVLGLGQWAWRTLAENNREIDVLKSRTDSQLQMINEERQAITGLQKELVRLRWYIEESRGERLPHETLRPPG